MTGNEETKAALLNLIEDIKAPGQTSLDAALNVIMHHAMTIREQHDKIQALESFARKFTDDLQELLEETP